MTMRNKEGYTIIGYGPLSKTFFFIEDSHGERYLVWASTGRYRLDGKSHPKDLIDDRG